MQARWENSKRSRGLPKVINSGVATMQQDLSLTLSLLDYFTSSASCTNATSIYYYTWSLFFSFCSLDTCLPLACFHALLCILSLSANKGVIGLVLVSGNYFWVVFRKFSLLTKKFCIQVTAIQIQKIFLSSSFSSYPLLGAGGQGTHDSTAFPWGFTVSPWGQATSYCSATAQVLP